ncbi:MAG: electron transport protein SCO1/SenC [Proteobacteria bacterium]|nr:MAG: electron transport protein SCO1/SenC [Pseudomonadota bacterium]
MKRVLFIFSVIAFIAGLFAVQQYLSPSSANSRHGNERVAPIAGKQFGGDFTLTPNDGKPVSLSDYRGKVVVLYFGYTSCPDVCPTSMALIGSAMKSLSTSEVADVQGIFISVDPERDTADRLMKYAQYFHKNFVGTTGTPEKVRQVAKQYGSYFTKVESGSALSYLMDHTSSIFIIGRDGQFISAQPHGANAQDIAEAIRSAL